MRRGSRIVAGLAIAVLGLSLTACEPAPSAWRSELVSINGTGSGSGDLASGGSGQPFYASFDYVLSPDGSKVAFPSAADDLGPTDTNGATDIYLRDLTTGTTTLVSTNAAGTDAADGSSSAPAISADGTKVAFASLGSDFGPTDTTQCVIFIVPGQGPIYGPCPDIYVRDLVAGTTSLISTNADGTDSSGGSSADPIVSPHGASVAFTSTLRLPGDSLRGGYQQVYLRDLASGPITLVSADATGTDVGDGPARSPRFSPDGTKIAFNSPGSDLVAVDTNDLTDVFVRDLAANTTSLVSVNAAGTDSAHGRSWAPSFSPMAPGWPSPAKPTTSAPR